MYLATILKYLATEVLELVANATLDSKKNHIVPRNIQLVVRNDEELSKLMGILTIANVHATHAFPKISWFVAFVVVSLL